MSTKGKILFVLVIVIVAMALAIPAVVSAKTYDYSDTPLLHKAYKGNVSSWGLLDQKNNPPGTETEMLAGEYNDIKASNNNRAEFTQIGKFEYHRFVFEIDENASDIFQIIALHEGYASDLIGGTGHSLYIWNYANLKWDFLNTTSVGTPDQVLTGTLTGDLSNYVQNGELQLLAITNSESSCPFLYTWNGTGYQFIGDINSEGGFGYPVPEEERAVKQPHSEDYTKVDGSQLVPQDGVYRLEIAEEQNEITYLDSVRLLAVDHSPGVEIYSLITTWWYNIPPFQIHTVKDPVVPISATDGNGVDILPLISEVDRECTEAQYYHWDTIEVDFGDLSGAEQIKLLYNAWIDWPGGPESAARREYIASHPGERYGYMPYVEVINENGEWERVTTEEHIGLPQAKPRTMVLDITDWFVTDDYRMRMNIWREIHVDYIAVDTSEDEEVSVTQLAPVSADLYWKGVSRQSSPDGREPAVADFYDTTEITGFSVYEGEFTRYGDVLPLLDEVDDRYVIMHVGDSISVNFDELPVAEGMERDYYLFSDGYYKENFVKRLLGQDVSSVEPLPFHGMSNYPYPEEESYPYDTGHKAYLNEYNTREFRASPDTSGHHTIYTDYVTVQINPPVGGDVEPVEPEDLGAASSEPSGGASHIVSLALGIGMAVLFVVFLLWQVRRKGGAGT